MTPAPTTKHQEFSGNLFMAFRIYLKKKKCKVFYAPFDVRLTKSVNEVTDDKIYTVVQPDLCVICDPAKIDSKGCLGAPDLIIEIVSLNNSKRDTEEKFGLYQNHGVREYWIVFPYERTVNVFFRTDITKKFEFIAMYAEDSLIPVNIFDGDLKVDLAEIFTE
jgi:Uma2 family endonuclease